MKQEAEIAREKAEEFLQRAQMEEKTILSQAREEAQELVRQAKEDLRSLISEFKAKGRTDIHRLSQKIKAEEEKITHRVPQERLEGLPENYKGAQGWRATRKPGAFGQLQEALGMKAGEKGKTPPTGHPGLIHYQIPSAVRELKVIGLRVEEALPLVDRTIDEAFIGGLKELEVIHGAGTGRLRKAIREHLRGHAFVKTFIPGGPGRGGDGVTVVEIGPAPAAVTAKRRSNKEKTERS